MLRPYEDSVFGGWGCGKFEKIVNREEIKVSNNSLNERLLSHRYGVYADGLFLIEIVAQHITFIDVIVVKVCRELIFAAFVVSVTVPDFEGVTSFGS